MGEFWENLKHEEKWVEDEQVYEVSDIAF